MDDGSLTFQCRKCKRTLSVVQRTTLDGLLFHSGAGYLLDGSYCKHCLLRFIGASPNDFPLDPSIP